MPNEKDEVFIVKGSVITTANFISATAGCIAELDPGEYCSCNLCYSKYLLLTPCACSEEKTKAAAAAIDPVVSAGGIAVIVAKAVEKGYDFVYDFMVVSKASP